MIIHILLRKKMRTGILRPYVILMMLIVNTTFVTGARLPPLTTDLIGMTLSDDCRTDHDCPVPLICNTKNPASPFCDCDPTSYTWSVDLEQCVGLVNTTCTTGSCVKGAFCGQAGTCTCSPSHSPSRERRCLLNYGQPCDDRAQDFCNPDLFLGCVGNRCTCKFPSLMKYEARAGECRMLVGEPCGVAEGTGVNLFHQCIKGAECLPRRAGSRDLECKCEAGRVIDPSTRTCLPSHGAQCRSSSDCDLAKSMICTIDSTGQGQCECHLGMTWNDLAQKCFVLPGESCSRTKECVPQAYCSPVSNLCECDPGHSLVRRTRSCAPSQGARCSPLNPCNEESLLRCQSGTCQCIEGHQWSKPFETCLGLVDTYCRESTGCTANAFCGLKEVCQCFPSYSPTPGRTCLVGHGGQCTGRTGCNSYEFLECRDDLCQCEAWALWDNRTCKSFIGGPCGLFEETMTSVECYEGTECILQSDTPSGTCQLTEVHNISKLKSSSVTLYVLAILPGVLIPLLIVYAIVRKVTSTRS